MINLREEKLKAAMESYTPLLLHVAWSYMGNTAEAEDIVHEVFLTYYQKAPLFQSTEHEKAWLLRVTANRCKNVLKSSWFKKILLGEEAGPYWEEPYSGVADAVLQLTHIFLVWDIM